MDSRKRQAIHDFHQMCRQLLSESERQYLYKLLKTYQRRHRVDKFVDGILCILRSRNKLELVRYIRKIIPPIHVPEFDRLLRQSMNRGRGKMNLLQVEQSRSTPSLYSGRFFKGNTFLTTKE